MRKTCITITLLTVIIASPRLGSQSNPLVGAWKVAEIVSPAGQSLSNPQPTMYLFTARHYSHVSVTSSTPRPIHAGPNLTERQRLDMWEPFSATAGVYESSGSRFTIRPIVAKNPSFMQPGSFTTFEFRGEGQDLWIRAIEGSGGPIPLETANRVRLVRIE